MLLIFPYLLMISSSSFFSCSSSGGSSGWGNIFGSWSLTIDGLDGWDSEGLLLGLLLGDGSLYFWVVLVGEHSRDWRGGLAVWVHLSSGLSWLLSVDGSDRWDLEGLLLSLLSGDGSLEIWLISIGRVEHSLDMGLAIWILLLLNESNSNWLSMVMVMFVLLLNTLDLNGTSLEVHEVNFVHGELVVDSRNRANEGKESQILKHFINYYKLAIII